ncbi:MAG: hypothetical protein ABEH77_01040, partial [Halobacteriaceae archaeon]
MTDRRPEPGADRRLPGRLLGRLPLGTLLLALLAGVAGVAGSYGVAAFTPSFVVGPIAGLMARRLPGPVITFAIVVLGDLGKQLNVLGAVGLLAAAAALGVVVGRYTDERAAAPVTAVLGAAVAYAVTTAPLASLAAGVAAGLVVAAAVSSLVL